MNKTIPMLALAFGVLFPACSPVSDLERDASASARAASVNSPPHVKPTGFYACWSPRELEEYVANCDRGGDCSIEEWTIIVEPYLKWKKEGEKVPNA